MKRWLICVGLMATLGSDALALEWLTDLPTALARAQKENKAVLLDFTGSDWCGWCQRLKAEVFEQFAFAAYANANLIMVEVDFPERKKLSLDQLNANHALAAKHDIQGYPTIIVLNADGQLLGRCGYVRGGPSAFIATLERFPGMPHKGGYAAAAPSAAGAKPPAPAAAAQPPTLPPPLYGDLTLKGISGTGTRRFVVINNQTLMAGESASVKTRDTSVQVLVKEIRDSSAVIVVKGETRELSLARPAPARQP